MAEFGEGASKEAIKVNEVIGCAEERKGQNVSTELRMHFETEK